MSADGPSQSSGVPWARSFPRGFWDEAVALRHGWRRPGRRFVVLAQGRSGSTLLTTLLDSHPDIRCEGELLETPRLAPRLFMENRARAAAPLAFGFHVKPYQLTKRQRVRDLRGFLREIEGRGWRMVHLVRENLFRQAISTMYAASSGRYHFRGGDDGRPPGVRLDPEAVIRKMTERADWLDTQREALDGLPHAELRYERDLARPDARGEPLGGTLDFLGVARRTLTSDLRPAVNRSLRDVVTNYDAVADAVARTRFAAHVPAETD